MATTDVTWESAEEEQVERPPLTPTQVAWRRFRRPQKARGGVARLGGGRLYVTVGAGLC